KNVKAVARIARSLPWPIYLAGDSQACRMDGCCMLGRLSAGEMAGWYSRAAIYAMPARYEPFGLSILEAALSGCALVLGDIGSLRELWQGAAEFVPPNDPDALAIACNALARDPARRARMASAARERALAFTPARMA